MKYKNKVTGALVETDAHVSGKNWENVEKEKAPKIENENHKSESADNSKHEIEEDSDDELEIGKNLEDSGLFETEKEPRKKKNTKASAKNKK